MTKNRSQRRGSHLDTIASNLKDSVNDLTQEARQILTEDGTRKFVTVDSKHHGSSYIAFSRLQYKRSSELTGVQ